jgi:AraC-like DNA-binding protein
LFPFSSIFQQPARAARSRRDTHKRQSAFLSLAAGFTDLSYFSRAFRRRYWRDAVGHPQKGG